MNSKNSQTFDIHDLCSSSDNFHQNKTNVYDEISKEIEVSEMHQDQRLASKLAKKNFYQKEIQDLQKKIKEPLEKEDSNEELFYSSKNHLQDSKKLSETINFILQEEKALKSRLSENKTFEQSKGVSYKNEPEELPIREMQQLKNDPFKKVMEKKEQKEEKSISDKDQCERKKLYYQYLKLLKTKKEELESKSN